MWEAINDAALARFALGQVGGAREMQDQQWVAGLRLMIAEPALQGEMIKAGAAAEAEFAAAVAERTGTDVTRDLYPKLVASAVIAAFGVAVEHWLRADSSVSIMTLLSDALRQLAAGLPAP